MTTRSGRGRPQSGRAGILTFLRLLVSIAGLALIVVGLVMMRHGSGTRHWPKVEGRVVSSTVNQFTDRQGTRTYRPMVIYGYSVGTVRFMNSRIALRPASSGTRDTAARMAARYPAGTRVEVYYDPQDPERSVLEPGGNFWVPIIAGGICSMFAVWLRMLQRRRKRSSE